MSTLRFLSFSSLEPVNLSEFKRKIRAIPKHSSDDSYRTYFELSKNGHCGIYTEISNSVKTDIHLSKHCGTHCFTYPPYGLSSLVQLKKPDETLSNLAQILRKNPDFIAKISPPTAIVSLTNDGCLTIQNDIRGLAELYVTEMQGMFVFSNVLGWMNTFLGRVSYDDETASSLRAVFSYYPKDYTPTSGIKRLNGGTKIVANDDSNLPNFTETNYLVKELSANYHETFSAKDASDLFLASLERSLLEAKFFFGGDFSQGLTGGRDSRLIFSGLAALGKQSDVDFYTIDTMSQEAELAKAIVAASGLRISHKILQPIPRGISTGEYAKNNLELLGIFSSLVDLDKENPLLARFTWHFHRNNGQVMPGMYFVPPTEELISGYDDLGPNKIALNGNLGEVLRAPKYTRSAIEQGIISQLVKSMRSKFDLVPMDVDSFSKSLRLEDFSANDFKSREKRKFFTSDVAKTAAACWLDYIKEAHQSGIRDFRVFDYFSIAAQQSRRIQLGKVAGNLAPLASTDLMNYAFRLNPYERSENGFHVQVISNLMPSISHIPFSHEFDVPKAEIRRDNSRFPMIFDETKGVKGFSEILNSFHLWNDTYDVSRVKTLFLSEPTQLNDYQIDRLACQLAWRATSKIYCNLLNDYI